METIRPVCLKVLSKVMKQPKNCETYEKYIYEKCQTDIETYKWVVFQVYGLLLKKEKEMKELLGDVKNGKIGWKSCTYDEVAFRIQEHDEYLVKPFEVEEGVEECSCGSKKVFSFGKQVKSSDEGTTTFCRCVDCGTVWTSNG